MNILHRTIMTLIGLDPSAYRPVDTSNRFNSLREMNDEEISAIDTEFNKHILNVTDVYSFMINSDRIRPHEFIIEMMRGYRRID